MYSEFNGGTSVVGVVQSQNRGSPADAKAQVGDLRGEGACLEELEVHMPTMVGEERNARAASVLESV